MNTFVKNLKKWLEVDNQRIALQRIYLLAAGFIFATSAVISLFDSYLGRQILIFAILSVLAFVANAVIWALSQAFLSSFESKNPKSKAKKSLK